MATKHVRVLLASMRMPDHDAEEVGGSVLGKLYTTAKNNFPTPPVDQPTLQTGLADYTAAIAATVHGGTHATNQKNKAKHDLVAMLRKLGLYAQGACNEDVALLTSTGFRAASTVRTLGPLPKAVIASVDNGHTTQLLVTITKIQKAASYELYIAQVAAGGGVGDYKQVGTFTRSRKIPVNGLTPGWTYSFKARAVGGTNGYGDFSDPVSHMSL
jgi:hypothetical protein